MDGLPVVVTFDNDNDDCHCYINGHRGHDNRDIYDYYDMIEIVMLIVRSLNDGDSMTTTVTTSLAVPSSFFLIFAVVTDYI